MLVASFANIFSDSIGCPFTFLMVSFAVQKLVSLIRFQLFIFVHGVRMCSNFIALEAAVQLTQNHLLKRLPSSHFVFMPPLSKNNWL